MHLVFARQVLFFDLASKLDTPTILVPFEVGAVVDKYFFSEISAKIFNAARTIHKYVCIST